MHKRAQYSILNNYRYALADLRAKEGTGAWLIYGAAVISSVALPFLEMAFPSMVVGSLTSGRAAGSIMALVAAYVVGLECLRFLKGYIQKRNTKMIFLYRFMLSPDLYWKCLKVEDQFLESSAGQKKMDAACDNIYSGESEGIEAFLHAFQDIFINLGGFLIYAVLMGYQTPILLLGVLVQAGLAVVFHRLAQRKVQGLEEENKKNKESFWALRRESILPESIKEAYLFRMDRWFIRRMSEDVDKIERTINKRETAVAAAKMGELALSLLRDGILYAYLLWMMAAGRMTLARFILYVGIVGGFGNWMVSFFDALQEAWRNNRMMNDWRIFMDEKTLDDGKKESPSHPGKPHEIRLEHVCFRYEGDEEDTIRDVSLTLRPGEKIALVGANGEGKTTLVKLISGLYRPTSGKIYLDGQDVSSLNPYDYFREFAVVFQDVFAFSFPIADNVSCQTRENTDEERLKSALVRADLWEKVQSLPKGLDTMMNQNLDPEGISLSGGELQRLMLARALYKDTPVVILDEPTASLDPIAESRMYEKYYEMIRGKSSIFISHRLSSTRFCDRILLLEDGRVAEEGSHEGLMAKKGSYAKMFDTQARYYKSKEGNVCEQDEELFGIS